MKWLVWVVALSGALTFSSVVVRADANVPAPATEAGSQLTAGTREILKLVNAGVKQEVLLGFIGNSTNFFNLSADDLIYLQGNGVPSEVTTAMLQRDQALRQTPVTNQTASVPPGVTNPLVNQSPIEPPVISETAPAVTQFYQALAPYGAWFQLTEWGWVWQPAEAAKNQDWRPYVDNGRWAWTDHGWYWESDYPWGWAAFHYGRWLQIEKLGWIWIPDTVWAPSWVTWRYHDDILGWAPLPPNALADHSVLNQPVINNYDYGMPQQSYTFVNVRYVFVHNVRPHCLPQPKVKEFYRHCKVVNDFAPGKHHGVVNKGVPIERISAVTGKHLSPVPVFDGRIDARRDAVTRRSPGFAPAPQHPNSRTPGFTMNTPQQPDNRPGRHTSSPTFGLPAAPRLPAAPGTPAPAPSVNSGATAAPMNPFVAPMNPIATPMNPFNAGNQTAPVRTPRPFTPAAPPHVVAPTHPGPSHGQNSERKTARHRNNPETAAPAPPAATSVQPAPNLRPSHAAAPKREGWAIPGSREQVQSHEKRTRN